ncbi:MAG: class I SAM-dependent methyltransferase [Verrucomicrobiota bacterium]
MDLTQALEKSIMQMFASRKPFDVENMARILATVDSARFFIDEMPLAHNFVQKTPLMDACLKQAQLDGLILEFGVFKGTSITHIAKQVQCPVYGFDSFEGLPEDWTHFQRKGRFSLEGNLPPVPPNVELFKGWFDDSLPPFLADHPGDARLIHIDCDIYSSTKTVLTELTPRIKSGTVIVFDEYFNYPGWQKHEHKAFMEFIEATGHEFEYIGFASSHFAVGVKIL